MIRMWNDKLHTNVLLQSAAIDNGDDDDVEKDNYIGGESDGDEIKEEKNEMIYSQTIAFKKNATHIFMVLQQIYTIMI